jgi:hypothetical protein
MKLDAAVVQMAKEEGVDGAMLAVRLVLATARPRPPRFRTATLIRYVLLARTSRFRRHAGNGQGRLEGAGYQRPEGSEDRWRSEEAWLGGDTHDSTTTDEWISKPSHMLSRDTPGLALARLHDSLHTCGIHASSA